MIKSSDKDPVLNFISTLDSIAVLVGSLTLLSFSFLLCCEVVVRINWSDLLKALCQAHIVSKDVHLY